MLFVCIVVCVYALFFGLMLVLFVRVYSFFFFKQKTAYDRRIGDWSADVCSSDLASGLVRPALRNSQVTSVQNATIPRDITSQAPQPQSPCHDHIAVPPHRTTLVSPSSHGGRPAASGTTADPPCGGLRVSTTTRRRRDAHGTAQPTRARVTHRSILVGLPGGAVLRPEVASVNVLHVGDRGGGSEEHTS